jgi:hypothetical protein
VENCAEIAYCEGLSALEGVNPSEQAVQSGQHAWSNRKRELLVRVPAQSGALLSDDLAEFLGFARLRPKSVAKSAIYQRTRIKNGDKARTEKQD